jgi:hypothetical protein
VVSIRPLDAKLSPQKFGFHLRDFSEEIILGTHVIVRGAFLDSISRISDIFAEASYLSGFYTNLYSFFNIQALTLNIASS